MANFQRISITIVKICRKVHNLIGMQSEKLRNQCQLIRESIIRKDLPKICQILLKANELGIPNNQWLKYMVNIFSMLTDDSIPIATFSRRSPILEIFKMTINIRLIQVGTTMAPESFLKLVKNIIKVLQVIFHQIQQRRNLNEKDIILLYSFIQKFLLIIKGAIHFNQQIKKKLTQHQTSILKNTSQFNYSHIFLWFQFFSNIKNYLTFVKYEQEQTIIYLSILRRQMEEINQPLLRWIQIFIFLKEIVKIKKLFKQSKKIQEFCLKQLIIVLKHIRHNYSIFISLQQTQIQKSQSENVLKSMIRFNTILMCFCFIQSLCFPDNSNLLNDTIHELKLIICLIVNRCSYEILKIDDKKTNELTKEQLKFYEKLIKLKIQYQWISYQLNRFYKLFSEQRQYFNQFLLEDCQAQPSFELSSKKISQIENQLINELEKEKDKEQKDQSISFVRPPPVMKMSIIVQLINELLIKSSKCLKKIFGCPSKSMLSVKIFSSLLTEYYFNDRQLFIMGIESAKKNLFQILSYPSCITSQSALNDIRTCIMILRLCSQFSPSVPQQIFICSACGYTWLNFWCNKCDQPNRLFVYPYQTPLNLYEHWSQCKQVIEYFVNSQLTKVPNNTQQSLNYILLFYSQVIE